MIFLGFFYFELTAALLEETVAKKKDFSENFYNFSEIFKVFMSTKKFDPQTLKQNFRKDKLIKPLVT